MVLDTSEFINLEVGTLVEMEQEMRQASLLIILGRVMWSVLEGEIGPDPYCHQT